ncbi:MAG: ABC transporter ATP-binding protein [Planctomycetota bacterium]
MDSTTPPVPALKVQGLRVTFGDRAAVDDVSFAIAPGEIHGFVGPNGAGKTTTLKVIATLVDFKRGGVEVFGDSVKSRAHNVRRHIGYMPDHLGMYRQMTIFEYLDFFGAAYGLSLEKRNKVIDDVLQLTDMHARRHELIRSLSRGMEQRVSLARVLVHDPKLLLLDEPASGLDPRARIELMDILKELARMGKTILISSHILSELANLCDGVTIVDRGKVKYTGSMHGLLQARGETWAYRLRLAAPTPAVDEALRALPGVTQVSVEADARTLVVSTQAQDGLANSILAAAMTHGGDIETFQPVQRQLDEAFLELTEPGVGG